MLKVPELDDITYEQMVQRSVSRIPAMTDEWTDFNSHDPGITVIQMYAWLADMLNYYMNATGDVHVQKYLKLLGIEAKKECAAESYIVIQNAGERLDIPAGALFYAGEIPFETEEDYSYTYNAFCSFINEVDGYGMDLTAFAGQDGGYAECFAEQFEKEAVLYLGFEKPLRSGDSLYFSVDENQKRNLFAGDFRLGELEWQYYSAGKWTKMDVQDETCGLLRSGFLRPEGIERMEEWKYPTGSSTCYYIRCVLRENRYDCLPRIGMLYVNPLKVLQQETICKVGEFQERLKIGKTNGCAGQEQEFDWRDVYEFSLALWRMEESGEAKCEIWHCTESLECADYGDRVFAYDRERGVVRFGDGIHGAVPMQNMPVSVTGLVCSRLGGGNVLAGEINRTDIQLPEGCRIWNPTAAQGGRNREEIHQMLARMETDIFEQKRMASASDYVERVLRTPGLILESAHVVPGKEYGKLHRQNRGANEIVVVVKPGGSEQCPILKDVYKRMIEEYIEPYRLVNTKVSIVSPEYVRITIHGKIAVYQNTQEARREIEECLKNAVDYRREKMPFGKQISYGRLFTALEALAEVRQVQELSLEQIGSGAEKNERGDILLHEDALSLIEAIDLEYC